ncbi:MAG TPA: DUF2914 domain-containing protein [Candidatus Polarisedimenticolia bacterium]|nr:DUF2914 domain-containing protein [Candidatus Polarisedimenticolia bacterium]
MRGTEHDDHEAPLWRQSLRLAAGRLLKWNLLFFVAGFAFDVIATRAGVEHTLLIIQQIVYLTIIGGILYVDFVRDARPEALPMWRWFEWLWQYRSLAFHFCLGTLMNLYSIFFLMSASLFSSIAFVVILFGAIVLNELHVVRRHGLDVKVAFYVLCIFCFWSLVIPIVLRSISRLTFFLSFAATLAVLAGFGAVLRRRIGRASLIRSLLSPGLAVSVLFLLMYLIGLIPPVPIAARTLGVYHDVERVGDEFKLSYVPSWWKVRHDDRRFVAQPGDVVHVFFAIFAPTRFDDTVFVRWSFRDSTATWKDSDRIPIRIVGGREEGFRGVATKENYVAGAWRVIVETRDGREIGRLRFTIAKGDADPERVLKTEVY